MKELCHNERTEVLLHGFPGTKRSWKKTLFALSEGVFGNLIQKLRKLMQKKPAPIVIKY